MLSTQDGFVFMGFVLYISGLQTQQEGVCTLKGSTVTLHCSAEHLTSSNKWYTVHWDGHMYVQNELSADGHHVVNMSEQSNFTLTIRNLTESDAKFYCCSKNKDDPTKCWQRAINLQITDSVTPSCFSVTYARGRMCSYKQTSVDEPCSITYPREVHVQRSSTSELTLTCNSSCPLIGPETVYGWYHNTRLYIELKNQHLAVSRVATQSISCAVKGLEYLLSPQVCVKDEKCWSVNYVSRRICGLEGSSIDISTEYSHPNYYQPESKLWYKIKRSGEKEDEELMKAAGRVDLYDNMRNLHTMKINNLKRNDSAQYSFKMKDYYYERWKQSDFPGVTLVVTGLEVKFSPSAVVTEGQRVTLTCSTSCPLTDNTNYRWYFNGRPLTLLPENQNKHLLLDPVSSRHGGNYSCAVNTHIINSSEETLNVLSITGRLTAAPLAALVAVGVGAVLLVFISLTVVWCIRKRMTVPQCPRPQTSDNTEQLNSGHMYENISAPPAEQSDRHYCRLVFSKNHREDLYSTIQPAASH